MKLLKKKAFEVTWRRSQFLNGIGRLSIVTEFPSYQRKFFSAFASPGYYCHLTNSPVVRHFWQLELLSCSMIPLSSSILESESRFFNQLLIGQSETLKISHYWIAKKHFSKNLSINEPQLLWRPKRTHSPDGFLHATRGM